MACMSCEAHRAQAVLALGDGDEVVDEDVDECCRLGEAVVRREEPGLGTSTMESAGASSSGSSLDRAGVRTALASAGGGASAGIGDSLAHFLALRGSS
jgi:hypothetical protein